jgi:hypothetical protein
VKAHEHKEIVEQEVNATVKLIMSTLEELAAMPPASASDPALFNDKRNRIIRKVWNLAKECIRYGASTVQPDEPR